MSCFIAIDTKKITNITTSTLNTGGLNILSTDPIVEKGIVYSYTSILPTIGFSNKEIYSKKGVGKFDVTLQGLSEGFTYYVRAYAISNTGDVSYGRTLEAKMLITAQSSCSMNVSLPVGKIYTIPDGYTLVGSSNNGSLQSTCIDVTKIENLIKECYGFFFSVTDPNDSAYGKDVVLKGININGVDYDFNEPNIWQNGNTVTSTVTDQLINRMINSNPYLSTVMMDGHYFGFNIGADGKNQVISFKGLPVFKDAYVYYSMYGTPTGTRLATFIYPIDQLSTQTGQSLTCI
jgi:hypothetical protein